MADPLMLLSLQPPPLPFLIFSSSSSLHRRWGLSRSGIRFSVSEFRLSSQLQLANSTSPSQSSSTAPEKFDLVSTTRKPLFPLLPFAFWCVSIDHILSKQKKKNF